MRSDAQADWEQINPTWRFGDATVTELSMARDLQPDLTPGLLESLSTDITNLADEIETGILLEEPEPQESD